MEEELTMSGVGAELRVVEVVCLEEVGEQLDSS